MDDATDPPQFNDVVPPARPTQPDPYTASSLADYVVLLEQLREWAAWPGKPPGFHKLEKMAHESVGIGALPRSTTHRILTGRQDLAFVRHPEQFVSDLVTTLGADSQPWLTVLKNLLPGAPPLNAAKSATDDAKRESGPSGLGLWSLLRCSRKAQVIAAALVLAIAGLASWVIQAQDAPAALTRIDYSRPAVIESGDTGLRLAIDPASDSDQGSRGVVLNAADAATVSWDLVAPYRDNPGYRQLRPTGKLLMCLEVLGGSFDERAPVQQWGCNGGQHQYWKPLPESSGVVLFKNLHSGQCLSVVSVNPDAGQQLVQRECDKRQEAQQWRVAGIGYHPSTSGPPPTSIVPTPTVGPPSAEYPGGGKDQSCDGLSLVLDPAAKPSPWSNQPFSVRDERPDAGSVSLGPGAAGAVYLFRANRKKVDGGEETYYWAEGFVRFTPKQFTMSLQWTQSPGPGGWHTCPLTFTHEYGTLKTVALPRDSNHGQHKDVAFRVCLSYQPERATARVVNCSERYS